MAGLTLLVLSLVVFVSSAEVQDQIRKLKDDIRSLQLQVENEHDFLVKYNARVEKLEKVFAEMRQERIELTEFVHRQKRHVMFQPGPGMKMNAPPLLAGKIIPTNEVPAGPPGPKGPPGQPGQPGREGPRGMRGDKGQKGSEGTRGPPGPYGFPGIDGPPGNHGPNGLKGEMGFTGFPGIRGDWGDEGLQGPDGQDGVVGPKGYFGHPGFMGAFGYSGQKGYKGFTGITGQKGIQGIEGAYGIRGKPGSPGPKGYEGPVGQRGGDGISGSKGTRGDQGPPGQNGLRGTSGVAYPAYYAHALGGYPMNAAAPRYAYHPAGSVSKTGPPVLMSAPSKYGAVYQAAPIQSKYAARAMAIQQGYQKKG